MGVLRMSNTSMPLFTGKYVTLRHIAPSDAPLYHIWLQNPNFLAYKPYLRRLCPTAAQLAVYLAMQAQSALNTKTTKLKPIKKLKLDIQ